MESQYVAQLDKAFVPVICEPNALRLQGDGGKMLNFLRGTKLYVDMSNMKQFDTRMPELVRGVRHLLTVDSRRGSDASIVSTVGGTSRVAELEAEVIDLKERVSRLEALVESLVSK